MDLFSAQPQPQPTSHLEYHRPPTTTQPHTHLSTYTTTDTKTTTATTPMTTNLLPTPGRWTLVLTIRRQVGGELRGGTAAAPPLQVRAGPGTHEPPPGQKLRTQEPPILQSVQCIWQFLAINLKKKEFHTAVQSSVQKM